MAEPVLVGHDGQNVTLRVADGQMAITATMTWRAARWLSQQLEKCASQMESYESDLASEMR